MPKTVVKRVPKKRSLRTKLKKTAPKNPEIPLFSPCRVSNLPVAKNHGEACYHLNCHQRYYQRGCDHLNDNTIIFSAIRTENTDILPFFWEKLLQEAAPATSSPRISEFSHILWYSFLMTSPYSTSQLDTFTRAFHAGMLHPAITHPRQKPSDVFLRPFHYVLLGCPTELLANFIGRRITHIVNLITPLLQNASPTQ